MDESKLRNSVISHSVQVLIANIPFSADHSDNPRKEASADDVIDLYLEQYKVEAGFRMMKSGMNIADVYIHTPSRITAVALIVCLATMVCKTIDFVLRKKKEPGKRCIAVKSLADIHTNTIVKYDRSHDRLSVMGFPGATHEIFATAEKLSINLRHLLGY